MRDQDSIDFMDKMVEEGQLIVQERGEHYENLGDCFPKSAELASIILGKEITAYDVTIILYATKLARLSMCNFLNSSTKNKIRRDTTIDANNYMVLAENEKRKAELREAAKTSFDVGPGDRSLQAGGITTGNTIVPESTEEETS